MILLGEFTIKKVKDTKKWKEQNCFLKQEQESSTCIIHQMTKSIRIWCKKYHFVQNVSNTTNPIPKQNQTSFCNHIEKRKTILSVMSFTPRRPRKNVRIWAIIKTGIWMRTQSSFMVLGSLCNGIVATTKISIPPSPSPSPSDGLKTMTTNWRNF